MKGHRIAVAGMGRSGMAIASAATRRGAIATVFDEHSPETPAQFEAVEQLQGKGIPVVTGWHGRLDPSEFDLLVASPGFRREHPAIRDMLKGGKEVISEVEFAYGIAESPILAITGTNGKSTTTVLTWLILKGAGVDAVLCGNISGSGYDELTLSEAADLGPEKVLVAEISSYQLEWIQDFRPKVAAITNITPDHLDRHPTFEDYFDTKLKIFSKMGEGDTAVLNESEISLPPDKVLEAIPPEVGIRSFTVEPAAFGIDRGQFTSSTSRVEAEHLVLSGRKIARSELPLYGDHNAINAVMAWEIAAAFLGGKVEDHWRGMLGALAEFKGLAYRMERIGERDGVLVINNSMCTNPKAVIASSHGISRRQHLIMGGQTKNLDFSEVAAYLDQSGHWLYLVGNADDDLVRQLVGYGKVCATLAEAFAEATRNAKPGESVILAPGCASAYPFANFRDRGDAFRKMAKAWIGSKSA